jgi:hypothetical protein
MLKAAEEVAGSGRREQEWIPSRDGDDETSRQGDENSRPNDHKTNTPQVAGNTANLPAQVMNVFMLLYILLRGVYVSLYVRTATQQKSFVRSLVWGLTACEYEYELRGGGDVPTEGGGGLGRQREGGDGEMG